MNVNGRKNPQTLWNNSIVCVCCLIRDLICSSSSSWSNVCSKAATCNNRVRCKIARYESRWNKNPQMLWKSFGRDKLPAKLTTINPVWVLGTVCLLHIPKWYTCVCCLIKVFCFVCFAAFSFHDPMPYRSPIRLFVFWLIVSFVVCFFLYLSYVPMPCVCDSPDWLEVHINQNKFSLTPACHSLSQILCPLFSYASSSTLLPCQY